MPSVEVRPDGDTAFDAVDGANVVGRVSFGADVEDGARGEVTELRVDEDRRREGIGTALLVAAEDALQAAGFEEAVMWVDQDDERAQRFLAWHTWSTDGAIREVDGQPTHARFRRLLGF